MLNWFKRSNKAKANDIVIDDIGVRRPLGDGTSEAVSWDALVEVSILTTDEGPLIDDVFFLLTAADGTGCAVSQTSPSSGALLTRLQQLPGFDNEQVIKAMGSTENQRFVCWRKTDAE